MSDSPRTDAIDAANDTLSPTRAYAMMRGHARRLERLINEHNRECHRLCDNRKRCGYEGYAQHMTCSDCPRDWFIEFPE